MFSRRGQRQLGKGCQGRGDREASWGDGRVRQEKKHEDRERAKTYFRSVYITFMNGTSSDCHLYNI